MALTGQALVDHINGQVARDTVAYKRARSILLSKGYTPQDFDPGGVLYRYDAQQLVRLIRG